MIDRMSDYSVSTEKYMKKFEERLTVIHGAIHTKIKLESGRTKIRYDQRARYRISNEGDMV